MRRFLRDNGIALFFGVLLLASLAGQSIAGYAQYNDDQIGHKGSTVGYLDYVTSGVNNSAVQALHIHQANFGTATTIPVQIDVVTSGRTADLQFRASSVGGPGGPAPRRPATPDPAGRGRRR